MNIKTISYKKITLFSILVSVAILLLQLIRNYMLCENNCIYATDDAYIHMAIGRNLADYNIWSTNKLFFTSASSSFLYTILLAICFKVFGNYSIYPYALNFIPYLFIFIIIFKYFKDKIPKQHFLIINVLLVLIYPLPLFGMEHSLHLLFVLLFLFEFDKYISGKKNLKLLIILSVILSMLRYESMFIIFSASAILINNKKLIPSLYILIIGLLPFLIYGIYSTNQGSYFVPNTLVSKGNFPEGNLTSISTFITIIIINLTINIHFTILLVFVLLYTYKQKFKIKHWSLLILTLTSIAHLLFAGILPFYRYEAYLLIPAIIYFIIHFNKDEFSILINHPRLYVTLRTIFYTSITFRLILNIWIIQMASKNIYEQQVQFTNFLLKYYNHQPVLVHDIGYLAYKTDVNIYDIAGIATLDVAATKGKLLHLPTNFIETQQKKYNFKIGVFYDIFTYNGMPKYWVKAGDWTIKHNRICGLNKINFYAIDSSQYFILHQQLKEFSTKLNKNVKQNLY